MTDVLCQVGIVKFLNARLDEDETCANSVITAARDMFAPWPPVSRPGQGGPALTRYLQRFGEYRMLTEIKAKREIMEEAFLAAMYRCSHPQHLTAEIKAGRCYEEQPEDIRTLRLLALPYSWHPDYDPRWADISG